ncbi:MAG: hypothetical protein OEM97_04005 [Acidimicrobiia bacterium]|nr:hypothetical protein [Acidimicrobiia bacterium]
MTDATQSLNDAAAPDPTLATLVPRRSVGRNVLLAVIAALVLAGVLVSPRILRPTVVSDSAAGTWSALAPHGEVVTMVRLYPDGVPFVDVQAVRDLPGAEVRGAWIMPDRDYGLGDVRPEDYTSGLEYLTAALSEQDFGSDDRLPQRLEGGATVQLVTLWAITDCSIIGTRPQPEVELRTALGSVRHELLDEIASPAFGLMTLTETGICP